MLQEKHCSLHIPSPLSAQDKEDLMILQNGQVAGTSGKIRVDGDSDDEGISTEAHGNAIVNALGVARRNEARRIC